MKKVGMLLAALVFLSACGSDKAYKATNEKLSATSLARVVDKDDAKQMSDDQIIDEIRKYLEEFDNAIGDCIDADEIEWPEDFVREYGDLPDLELPDLKDLDRDVDDFLDKIDRDVNFRDYVSDVCRGEDDLSSIDIDDLLKDYESLGRDYDSEDCDCDDLELPEFSDFDLGALLGGGINVNQGGNQNVDGKGGINVNVGGDQNIGGY